jgi:hypothetical protein
MKSSVQYYLPPALTILLLVTLVLFTCGCIQQPALNSGTQTVAPQTVETSVVTAEQPDNSHIIITYHGGQGMEKLIELETTVMDSQGGSKTQSTGTRLATTPVKVGGTSTFTGSFAGNDHVVVTGYFSDGRQQVLLDIFL